jgi:hypothetical protein
MGLENTVQKGMGRIVAGLCGLVALPLVYAMPLQAATPVKYEVAQVEQKALLADKYDPRGIEVNEYNFKDTLKKEGLVWVMYEYTGAGEVPFETDAGEKFWRVLKQEFGTQVDAYIKINVDAWSNTSQKAIAEIKRNVFPSFILYMNGTLISNNDNDVRIRGPPKTQERIQYCLDYIRMNSTLK